LIKGGDRFGGGFRRTQARIVFDQGEAELVTKFQHGKPGRQLFPNGGQRFIGTKNQRQPGLAGPLLRPVLTELHPGLQFRRQQRNKLPNLWQALGGKFHQVAPADQQASNQGLERRMGGGTTQNMQKRCPGHGLGPMTSVGTEPVENFGVAQFEADGVGEFRGRELTE